MIWNIKEYLDWDLRFDLDPISDLKTRHFFQKGEHENVQIGQKKPKGGVANFEVNLVIDR